MTVVNEQIVTGRKFRKLIDEASRLWMRISFWTKACDVEFDDGETAETKFADLKKTIDNLTKSFQDGVNKIFNYLKGLGFTPSTNSPDGICSAIQDMYNKRYTDGRTQGQKDVIDDPEDYGISTDVKYFNILSCNDYTDFDVYTTPKAGTYTITLKLDLRNNGGHNGLSSNCWIKIPSIGLAEEIYFYGWKEECNGWIEEWVSELGSDMKITYVKELPAGAVITVGVAGTQFGTLDNGDVYQAINKVAVLIN